MSFDHVTDGELLARFAGEGDDAAFERIVRRHAAMVYRVCARHCLRSQDAEDAAQMVFATLARRAATLVGRASLAGWLHRTAGHTAMRWRRGDATRSLHERRAGLLRPVHDEGGDGLPPRDELDQLERALGALPEDYRNALILHHLEGHTVGQVALLLAAPPGTIAARLSRGRAMLRERLAIMGVMIAPDALDYLWNRARAGEVTPEFAEAIARSTGRSSELLVFCPPQTHVSGAAALAVAAGPLSLATRLKVVLLCFALPVTAVASGAAVINVLMPPEPNKASGPAAAPRVQLPEFTGGEEPISFSGNHVPEPSTLMVLAPLGLLASRRRRRIATS